MKYHVTVKYGTGKIVVNAGDWETATANVKFWRSLGCIVFVRRAA